MLKEQHKEEDKEERDSEASVLIKVEVAKSSRRSSIELIRG